MKIIQLNIWLGHLLHPALDFIDNEAPDILCAQEVISAEKGHNLYAFLQTHERLSERFPYNFMAPTHSFNALGQICKYGNAIYSKHPISNMNVEFTVGSYKEAVDIDSLKQLGEIRNLQYCEITPKGQKSFYVANHHGYHNATGTDSTAGSEASMSHVAKTLKKIKQPLIFCGDLNASPASKTLHELDNLGLRNLSVDFRLQNTLSKAHRLDFDFVCDYIFTSPELPVKSFKDSNLVVSDHKPLILEIG
jgi:endonuclease/exonuclease/phosphatase family metal-dependent hydrolase